MTAVAALAVGAGAAPTASLASGPAPASTAVAATPGGDVSGGRLPVIVGGSVAAPGAWPWMTRVDLVAPDGLFGSPDGQPDVVSWCGGSLIGARWILTAGHCVLFDGQVIGSPASRLLGFRFQVVVGETSAFGIASTSNVYDVDPDDVMALLPAAGTLSGDLALMRLARPAPQPALRIIGAGQDPSPVTAPGVPATAIGWGSTSEDGDTSPELRQVTVPIVSDQECDRAYPAVTDFFGTVYAFDAHTMICAGAPGQDACFGDSGGPLMAPDGLGSWVQVGITSWGEGCGRVGLPGIYGRVPGLFGFILSTLEDDLEAPAGPPQATTDRAAGVTKRSARLIGTVNPNGLATVYLIEFGINRRYTSGRVQAYVGSGSDAFAVSTIATRLKPGTTYHYRISAFSLAGVAQGIDRTFTTKPEKR